MRRILFAFIGLVLSVQVQAQVVPGSCDYVLDVSGLSQDIGQTYSITDVLDVGGVDVPNLTTPTTPYDSLQQFVNGLITAGYPTESSSNANNVMQSITVGPTTQNFAEAVLLPSGSVVSSTLTFTTQNCAGADTDEDGLLDWEETNACFLEDTAVTPYVFPTDCDDSFPDWTGDGNPDPTNPNAASSDGDTLNDGDELRIHNTNPRAADTDQDGVLDDEEIQVALNPNLPDSDFDGLSDYEERNLQNCGQTVAAVPFPGIGNCMALPSGHVPYMLDPDSDNDGLSDWEEVNGCESDDVPLTVDLAPGCTTVTFTPTHPNEKDTDAGGVDDGQEIVDGTDPNNPNDDLVSWGDTDTDQDGFLDWEESNGCILSETATLPFTMSQCATFFPDWDNDGTPDSTTWNDADTDGDGLSDYEEIINTNSNPNAEDTDMDGLDDQTEVNLSYDPANPDTDGDGLSDYEERTNVICDIKFFPSGCSPLAAGFNPQPLVADTDSDGMNDWEELNSCEQNTTPLTLTTEPGCLSGGFIYIGPTNPSVKDTDNGGEEDFDEVMAGRNPLNPIDDVSGTTDDGDVDTDGDVDGGVDPSAFQVVKTSDTTTVDQGGFINYVVNINNPFTENIIDFVALDPLAEGLLFVEDGSGPEATGTNANTVVTIYFDVLEPGANEVTVRVAVAADATGDVCNAFTSAFGTGSETEQVQFPELVGKPCHAISIVSDDTDTDTGDADTDGDTDGVEPTEFTVVKSSPDTIVTEGQTIEYVVEIYNTTGQPVLDFTLVDPLASELTFEPAGSAAQASANADGSVVSLYYPTLPTGKTTSSFFVTVTSRPADGAVCNAISTALGETTDGTLLFPTIEGRPCTDVESIYFRVTKTSATEGQPVLVTRTVEYTLTVENVTDTQLLGISITDQLPAGTSFVAEESDSEMSESGNSGTLVAVIPQLNSGETKAITYSARVDLMPSGGEICNQLLTATAPSTSTGDPIQGTILKREACHPVLPAGPAFTVQKEPRAAPAELGEEIQFAITFTNTGTEDLTGIQLTDTIQPYFDYVRSEPVAIIESLPEVTWNLPGPIAPDETISTILTVRPNVQAIGRATLLNAVIARTDQTITEFEADSAEVPFAVPDYEFFVTKTANLPAGTVVKPGDEIEYDITVTNISDSPIESVVVTDLLEPGLRFVGPDNDTIAVDGQTITLNFQNLPAGGDQARTQKITAQVRQPAEGQELTQVCNMISSALVNANAPIRGHIADNLICYPVGEANASYTVTKTTTQPNDAANQWEAFEFTIEVENTGNVVIEQVVVRDRLPATWELVSITGDAFGSMNDDGQLVLNFGQVNPMNNAMTAMSGQTPINSATITVIPTETGRSCNGPTELESEALFANETLAASQLMGEVCIQVGDQNPGGDDRYVNILKLSNQPVLPNRLGPGALLRYTVRVTAKDKDLTDVLVEDVLPTGTLFQEAYDETTTHANGVVTLDFGDIPAGVWREQTFQVSLNNATSGQSLPNDAEVAYSVDGMEYGPLVSNVLTHGMIITTVTPTTPPTVNPVRPIRGTSGSGSSSGEYNIAPIDADMDEDDLEPITDEGEVEDFLESAIDSEKPFCEPVICPSCFTSQRLETTLSVFDPAPNIMAWANEAILSYGDTAQYQVNVDVQITNEQNYDITGAMLYLYDVTVPMTDGGFSDVYGRQLTAGDDLWEQVGGNASRFRMNLQNISQGGLTGVDVLNAGEVLSIPLGYEMKTDLVESADIAQGIDSVAFAVVAFEYTDLDGDVTYHVQSVGDGQPMDEDQCQNPIEEQMLRSLIQPGSEAFASYGSKVSVDIVRPFAAAVQGAALAVSTAVDEETGREQKLFGTNLPPSLVASGYEEQLLYSAESSAFAAVSDSVGTEFATFTAFMAEQEDYFRSLAGGAIVSNDLATYFPNESAEGYFEKTEGQNIFFFYGDRLELSGEYMLSAPITIVLENADLVIAEDVTFPSGKAAFVVQEGNVMIENEVEIIEGAFVVEGRLNTGLVTSYDAEGETTISRAPLTITGLWVGGNPEQLLDARVYIGVEPGEYGIEPNVEIRFDDAILESEPPGLSEMLGENLQAVQ